MLRRLLASCGCRNPDDLTDFLMTGVAVVPLVVLLGTGFDEAIGVILIMLPAMVATIPWLHARSEAQRREEEAQALARATYLKQVTGRDR